MAPFVPFVFHLQSQDANFLFAGWLGKTKKNIHEENAI